MLTIRTEELSPNHRKDDFLPARFIIEVPINKELMQDCYTFAAQDAPSELKRMFLEALSETIDELILKERPAHVSEKELKLKLSEVKIVIKNK